MEEENGATTSLRQSKTMSSRSTLASEARRRRRSCSPYRANTASFIVGNDSSVSLLPAKCQDNSEKISYVISDIPVLHKEDTSTCKAVISILSGLYGLLLVAVGVVLTTSSRVPPVITQGFYLFLYCGGGALTVLLLRCKQKAFTEDEATAGIHTAAVCFGTLYLRISAVGFGVLGMLYIGLQLIQSIQCEEHLLLVLTTAAWLAFTLLQTLLVFRSGTWGWVMSRVILAHLLACNMCIWFQSVMHRIRQELPPFTEVVLMNVEQTNTTAFKTTIAEVDERFTANASDLVDRYCDNGMIAILEQYAVPILFPCTVEYSVLCIFITLAMWRNATGIHQSLQIRDGIENNPSQKVEEDWQCGLFCGLLVLVGTALNVVLYFLLYQEPGFQQLSSMLLDITILTLLIFAILATFLLCIARTRQRNGDTGMLNSPVDGAVLWLAQAGVFFSHAFSAVSQLLAEMSPTRLAVSLVTVAHSSVLTPFLLAPRKAPNAARQLLGFTLAVLVSLVVVCHLDYARTTGEAPEWNGQTLWVFARHIFGPLRLLYHVQSTVTVWHLLRESCRSSEMYL